ncbi:MAG: flagellar basal body P-ring formation chaperone FlgA [Desulforhopalus sp.]|nr:flagellar basal body P-ring formation chaperone FlgA [Desulforhopalus sp.]
MMIRFLLIMVLFFSSARVAPALEITFNKRAQVTDSVIRLGDVATFDEQTSLTEALATQPIGQAPPPGESLFLRAQNIKQGFASNHSLPGDTSWGGSGTISVSREGVIISPDRIKEIIAEFIEANKKNLPKAEIQFIAQSLPLPFTIPKGNLDYEVIPSNPAILGSSSMAIIFKVDDKVVRNMSVRGKIEALAEVVTASEPLKKGLILRPQHLKMATMNIGENANTALSPDEVVGMQLVRPLAAGSPIATSMIEALPIIKRGQKVRIIVTSGALHLTATGFAHNDGKLDEMIKVQNLNSNKTIYGRVAAPGTVEVIL